MKKRIITCSDGTWNKYGTTDRGSVVQTNVEKMFNSICAVGEDEVPQCKIYDEGVGTGYTWQDKIFGGLTGSGIDKNIKDVYTFIALNYKPGDEIFLYGFSRGAYTARSIAGLIRNCGVLKPKFINLVDKAYELYRDRNAYSTPDADLMKSFRSNYCVEETTPIKFIGVWDTVGSLGIPLPWYQLYNKNRYKFHDVTLSSTIEHAYHALAVDEKRVLFTPTLWQASNTVKQNSAHPQILEQRWFPGVHSNVGGGYADCGLSDLALTWLMEKARHIGLCFDQSKLRDIKPNPLGELRNSYTLKYWFWLPKWRQISFEEDYTYQTIDDSVWERFRKDAGYRPENLKAIYNSQPEAPEKKSKSLIRQKQAGNTVEHS